VRSPWDSVAELQEKMVEYIDNGAQLGWRVDPFERRVYVSRPGRPVETLDNPASLGGEPVLPGFSFELTEIW
jgi:Uma2 family endonuclease